MLGLHSKMTLACSRLPARVPGKPVFLAFWGGSRAPRKDDFRLSGASARVGRSDLPLLCHWHGICRLCALRRLRRRLILLLNYFRILRRRLLWPPAPWSRFLFARTACGAPGAHRSCASWGRTCAFAHATPSFHRRCRLPGFAQLPEQQLCQRAASAAFSSAPLPSSVSAMVSRSFASL